MKIGYGTYGMPMCDPFDALPRLRDIGYEAVELNAGADWPTAPDKFDRSKRDRLVRQLQDLSFPPPVIMSLLPICTQGEDRSAVLQQFDAVCALATDLQFEPGPAIVVSTPGGLRGEWNDAKGELRNRLLAIADRAANCNVILAVEPHAGQMLDTPEKVDWLMAETRHEHLKINFDISHFHVIGCDLKRSVELCAPHTVSTHIKDGYMADGKVQYLLPGDGDLDLTAYFNAVAAEGITVPITVEITAQIWRRPDYDPWAAAESAFRALDAARREANA